MELNKEEKEEFKVKERINSICTTAHKNNVRLFIDAEKAGYKMLSMISLFL